MESFFDAFVCAGGRFSPDELVGQSSRFKMAMGVLARIKMQYELRGAIGAASMGRTS